jgi:hypothetical protein
MTKTQSLGILTLAVLSFLLSCGKDVPVTPAGSQQRVGQNYIENARAIPLMPRPADEDGRYFYDADISEILQGPGLGSGDESIWQDDDHNSYGAIRASDLLF